MKTLRRPLLLCSAFLVSCLNYKEELWIHADGSGKIHATIAIHADLAGHSTAEGAAAVEVEEDLKKTIEENKGTTVESYQSFVQGSEKIWDFVIRFDDLKNLKPVLDKVSGNMGSVFGDFVVEKKPDLTSITRIVDLSGSREAVAADTTGAVLAKTLGSLISSAMFGGYSLEYTVHYPTEVITANSLQIGSDKRSVRWRFSLAEATKEAVMMKADIESISPLPKIVAISAAALLLVLVAIKALPRKRKAAQ